jgi:hypothetical protein
MENQLLSILLLLLNKLEQYSPPKAKAAACVPAPAKNSLAVFKPAGFVVQVEPSYSSVAPV